MINKRKDLMKLVHRVKKPRVVEIGSYVGNFAEELLKSHDTLHLTMVDVWLPETVNEDSVSEKHQTKHSAEGAEDMYESVKKRFAPFGSRVEIVREYSPDAAKFFREATFDLVYIDACHQFKPVRDDIRGWWPTLKVGGWMTGHDYNNRGAKRVKKAVDSVFGESNIRSTTADRPGSWYIQKTEQMEVFPHGQR
jgi:hypothetical protein